MQRKFSLIITILTVLSASLTAQNGTNSPYTRYGFGNLADRSFGAGRSMGGVGVGLRLPTQINPMNPASYSSMDSLTFLFDFGVTGQYSWYQDGSGKQNDINGNVEYVALQFPFSRRLAMSAGLLPFSHVGYKFGSLNSANGYSYTEAFSGTGGLNQLYAGLSIDVWKRRLSVGANVNYLFGTITHQKSTTFSSGATAVMAASQFKAEDILFDAGLQYTHPISKTKRVIVGLTYTPKKRLKIDTYESVSSNETVVDTVRRTYDIPSSYGAGFSFVKDNMLMLAADVTYQDWKSSIFADRRDGFKNRMKIAAGVEYIPNMYSGKYLGRVRCRFGLNYANSYIQVGGNDYKEMGATLGFGFPISDNRSFVNVAFEYVKIRPSLKTMIGENYLKLTLSYTFNEFWFFKQKLD